MNLLKPSDDIFDGCRAEEVLLLYNVLLHLLRYELVFVKQYACDSLCSLSRLDEVYVVIICLTMILLVLSLERWQG